ncbi:agamous-like MADS-box protein AGL80 [Dioscorea cayenensis subsp. rotundata]|uniref:Agamous-like MADS-box protein AGL80 n=1 Tax=Dioscorea cayennensis subsp. rotundata TaxID=55577 RepID=A0AB40BM10_DIOCR|nr:agamous-like MADS-box protein AGL80 [Dioscorea cayenensis subsp. rotundata]
MARKKVKLAWIPNDSARRATFRKRRKGLMKKLEELSILCDVEACGIIYGPDEPQPEVWPSKAGTRRVLERFKSMPVMEQSKKMMDQEGFTRHQVMKLQDQLRKHERENQELETAIVMHKCLSGEQSLEYMNMEELTNLAIMVEAKLKAVHDRIELISVQMTSNDGAIVVQQNNNNNNNHQWELATMETMQKQQTWFTDVINPVNDPNVYYGGEEAMQPYMMSITNLNIDPPYWV